MSGAQFALNAIEHAFPIVNASAYMTISGVALFIYDYFLTLSDEKDRINLEFEAQRYFHDLSFDRLGLNTTDNVPFCKIWIWLEGYLMIFSFMSMHALVAMRVHALHGGKMSIKILLWSAGLLYGVATCGILAYALWQRDDQLGPALFFHVCFEEISPILWTIWLPSLVLEGLLFFLTLWKAYEDSLRDNYSPITHILFRDGILYFFSITGCSALSMFVWLFGSPLMVGLVRYWAFAVVNVAGSRLVLSLKTNARDILTFRQQGIIETHASWGHDPIRFNNTQYFDLVEFPDNAVGTVMPRRTIYFEAI
ncbi:hypothetical protein BD410DRAFT_888459 [Rickenella mellea]|uniref:Uncharacterized protein n=1 Tax=Rickenella mellea TaxID=50990 RepID=A0A4Y7PMY6_9AGAM|nr:hypothetical protein BD410DRAFT_888459 [Rickenella mellea]